MGSRVQKIAFLIFALMFVAIMAVLNTSVLTLGTSANDQLTTVVASDDSTLSIYDDTTVYGSTVINCAKNPNGVTSTPVNVQVITGDGNDTTYGTLDDADSDSYTVSNASDAGYINRTAKFHADIDTNENGVVDLIIFTQEGATAD